MTIRFPIIPATLALSLISSAALAQPTPKRLLQRASEQSAERRSKSIASTKHVLARVETEALAFDRIELELSDDVRVTARRTSRSHRRIGSTVWFGKLEAPDRGDVTLVSVNGAMSASVTANGRVFEIGMAGGGLHEVREVDASLYPAEDSPLPALEVVSSGSTTSSATSTAGTPTADSRIDVMVVWTPAARSALGGSAAAIQSLVDLAVANANASYTNSQINASLRLVYSGEVNFIESPTSISTDLAQLSSTSDGSIDEVHTLRNQYGADIVTLIGSGYATAGYCGFGYLMSSVSVSFASSAFNVIDQACAGANLSYVHEVGHNQGLHHDPANAVDTPAYSYAYGYQEPSGAFRTVMSYGGAIRVSHFSNPDVLYGNLPTGTSTQNNAHALNQTASTVANFRSASESTRTCSYTLTPTFLQFTESGGTASIDVITEAGCSWTTEAGADWVTVGPGGSGPGSVLLKVEVNASGQRAATATVAGVVVNISEAGATPTCTYAVTPASASFGASGGTAVLNVTTSAGCSWTAVSSSDWISVTAGTTGSGGVLLTSTSNAGSSRNAELTVAGQTVVVTQEAMSLSPPLVTACTYTLSATSVTVPSTGGAVQIQVGTDPECSWSAEGNASWLKVGPGTTGPGAATLRLRRTSGGPRTATVLVAGQTVTVTQVGNARTRK